MTIYLDNMAATPVDPRVAQHYADMMLELPGNGHNAEHSHGAAAFQRLETAIEEIGGYIGRPAEMLSVTPGASSALWFAIEDVIARSPARPSIAVSAAEHPALLSHVRGAEASGRASVKVVPVDETGRPILAALEAIATDVDLICTMAANNEVGTITDIGSIGVIARAAGARLLVDASQAGGRLAMEDLADADYLVLSGAKMYGPRRVGILAGSLNAQARARGESLYGSPDVAGACALALACRLRLAEGIEDELRIAAMRDHLQQILEHTVPGLVVNGAAAPRLAGSLHVSAPNIPGDAIVARLWGQVSVSTGAACQSLVSGPSHVLTAMGLPDWIADNAVRIGIGRFNSMEDIEQAAHLIGVAMTVSDVRRYA